MPRTELFGSEQRLEASHVCARSEEEAESNRELLNQLLSFFARLSQSYNFPSLSIPKTDPFGGPISQERAKDAINNLKGLLEKSSDIDKNFEDASKAQNAGSEIHTIYKYLVGSIMGDLYMLSKMFNTSSLNTNEMVELQDSGFVLGASLNLVVPELGDS